MANGEQQGNGDVRTGRIQLSTGPRTVEYTAVDGLALFEGDIILGTVEQLEPPPASRFGAPVTEGIGITGDQYRWPNCTVPYTIDPALPDPQRVTEAIAHWQEKTNYRFVQRTSEPDFVTFRRSTSGCSAEIGRRGFQQFVNIGPFCTTGNVIHEIGHTIGLWHEQSRADRDRFVRIHWDRIAAGKKHNFDQHITDGDDIGQYDYGSIMHYGQTAFSADEVSTTIEPLDPNAAIGQREGLSPGDIAAANALCKPQQPVVVNRGKRRAVKSQGEGEEAG